MTVRPAVLTGISVTPFADAPATLPADRRLEDRQMELVLPDRAQVRIIIGNGPPISLSNEAPPQLPAPQPRRLILKGGAIAMLALGAFLAGRLTFPHPNVVEPARAALAVPLADPAPHANAVTEQHAFPDHALPAPARIPEDLARQLSQPPVVVPPPGQPPTGDGTGLEKFGLGGG
jgi:hypothetical protein